MQLSSIYKCFICHQQIETFKILACFDVRGEVLPRQTFWHKYYCHQTCFKENAGIDSETAFKYIKLMNGGQQYVIEMVEWVEFVGPGVAR